MQSKINQAYLNGWHYNELSRVRTKVLATLPAYKVDAHICRPNMQLRQKYKIKSNE